MTNETETRELTSAELDHVAGGDGVGEIYEISISKTMDTTSSSGLSGGKVSVSSFNFMKKTD